MERTSQQCITDPTTLHVLVWVERCTGPLRPLRLLARCSHCRRGRRLPYTAYCRRCYNAYQRWYAHRTSGRAPALVERYREAFRALAAPVAPRAHVSMGLRWCNYHQRGCPVETFTKNRSKPDGLEQYCRRARNEWAAARKDRAHERGGATPGSNAAPTTIRAVPHLGGLDRRRAPADAAAPARALPGPTRRPTGV